MANFSEEKQNHSDYAYGDRKGLGDESKYVESTANEFKSSEGKSSEMKSSVEEGKIGQILYDPNYTPVTFCCDIFAYLTNFLFRILIVANYDYCCSTHNYYVPVWAGSQWHESLLPNVSVCQCRLWYFFGVLTSTYLVCCCCGCFKKIFFFRMILTRDGLEKPLLTAQKCSSGKAPFYRIWDMTRGMVGGKLTKKSGNYIGKLK